MDLEIGYSIISTTAPDSLIKFIFVFLDDTEVSEPTVHLVDLQGLGIQDSDIGWSFPMAYNTANGLVVLPTTIWLEAAFSDILANDFSPVTSYKFFLFAVSPNIIDRLGGPLLRSLISPGTLPGGRGRMATAITRTGLSGLLREHANNWRR